MFDTSLRIYLRERLGLKGTPLNLLVTIVGLSRNERGHSWASLAYLGMRIERAARTARKALSKLRSLGLVRTEATGRNLHCTPAWEALGLDPADESIPTPGAAPPNPRAEPAQEQTTPAPQAEPPPPPDACAAETAVPADEAEAVEPVEPELAQIRQRFGIEAERDVADVLNSGSPSASTTHAARAAPRRLLTLEPEHIKHSVGAYFRSLFTLAVDNRLSPAADCTPETPPCTDPLDAAVKAHHARVLELKQQLERLESFDEDHRALTNELHRATNELIRLRGRQDVRDHPRPTTPPRQAPPPPPMRRTGPPPAWAQAYVPEPDASPPPS